MCVCVCVCVCVWTNNSDLLCGTVPARESKGRPSECVCVCICVCVQETTWMHYLVVFCVFLAYVRDTVFASLCVCVCERDRERQRAKESVCPVQRALLISQGQWIPPCPLFFPTEQTA